MSTQTQQLDLSSYAARLSDPDGKFRWDAERVRLATEGYQTFFERKGGNPTLTPVPDVDEVWHLHILDTRRYAEDCDTMHGRFVHHTPRGLTCD